MTTPHFGPAAVNPKRIFFSYGHDENRPIVERFKWDLEARGHQVWIDYDRIGTWDDWRGRIAEGILESEMAVAFLSLHSVRNPGVCRNEIAMALQRFGRVYPLLVEKLDSTTDLPITLEHLQWPDLSGWRDLHDGGEGSEAFEKYYLTRLAEVIGKIEGDATRFEDETRFLEKVLRPVSFEGRFHQHLEAFTGRRWLFEAFEEWSGRSGASRVFWLSAGPGFGKTAWAVNLVARKPAVIVGTWFCLQGSHETTDPSRALMTLAFQLAQRLDDYRARLIDTLEDICPKSDDAATVDYEGEESGEEGGGAEESETNEGTASASLATEAGLDGKSMPPTKSKSQSLTNHLAIQTQLDSRSPGELFDLLFSGPMCSVIPRSHKHVLLIDALDEAAQANGTNPLADLLDSHLQQLPEWLGAVVTSRPDPSTRDRLGRYAPVEIQSGDERNLGDLREFAERFLAQNEMAEMMASSERQTLVETLVRKSEGMVLYLQRVAEAIAQGALNIADIDSIGSGISGLESQYLRDFQHRFASGFEEKFQPLLRLLLGAPGDLTEDFCSAVLGDKEAVRRTRIQLGSFITCESGRLRLYHKTLADWLAGERSSVFFTDPAKGRRHIAEFLWKCFADRDRDSEDKKIRLQWEDLLLAWLPDLMPLLPQWKKAADLRALGEFLNSRKHFKASVGISGRAYRMRKRENGATHKFTLRAGGAYGIALRESGELEKAEPLLREILRHRREQGGDENPLTIRAMENLAKLLYQKKAYSECIELRRSVCDCLEHASGEDSEKTQLAMYRLGLAEEVSGNKARALATFSRLQRIREINFGFTDMRTLRVANRIAVIQRDSGDLESSRMTARRMVDEMEKHYLPTDSYLLTNRSLLGSIEEKIGNLEAAEDQYRKAFTGRQANDPQAPPTILSLTRLGGLLLRKGEFHEGGALLEQAWGLRGGIKSLDDQDGLNLLGKLARAWNRTDRRREALNLMRQNLPFFETGVHPLLYNLACYECLEGQHPDAIQHITAFLSKNADWIPRALEDPDLEGIRGAILKLQQTKENPTRPNSK